MRFQIGENVKYQRHPKGRWKVAKVLDIREDGYVIANGVVHFLPEDRLRKVDDEKA